MKIFDFSAYGGGVAGAAARMLLGLLPKAPYTPQPGDGAARMKKVIDRRRLRQLDAPANVKMNWLNRRFARRLYNEERKSRKKMWKAEAIMKRRKGIK